MTGLPGTIPGRLPDRQHDPDLAYPGGWTSRSCFVVLHIKQMTPARRLDSAGVLVSVTWLLLASLSHRQEDLSVWAFIAIMAVAWLGVLYAWRLARQLEPGKLLPRLWFWAVLFRLVGLCGKPVLENDFYRYLWDGRQFALTGNPYATAPGEHFAETGLPVAFMGILDGVNYPQVRTIYGPVTEAAFAVSYWAAPAQLWPLKLLLIGADLLTIWLLLRLVKPSNVLLYAWCPLLIKETAFTAHPDTLGIFLLMWGLYAFQRGKRVGMAVASALAVGAKVFAVLLVPFLLWRAGKRNWLIFGGALAAVYLPFWLQGGTADWAGLSAFVKYWEFNSSVYAVLSYAVSPGGAKLICGMLFFAGAILYLLSWRSRPLGDLPRGDLILGLFFLLSATVNAWYLLWLLPFVALFPSATGVTALTTISLSYVSGLNLGDVGQVGHHPAWVRPIEYGAILVALVIDCRRWRANRAPSGQPFSRGLVVETAASGSFLDRTLVLIPALNEAECVDQTVAYWRQLGARIVRVVDNGSTDATAQAAREAGAEVVNEPERGYGAAAWRGLQNPPAEIEWVLFSSADGSDQLARNELQQWQKCVDAGFHMLLGDRFGPLASRQHLKAVQSFGNRLCCRLIALGWGRQFDDMGSLRLVHLDALQKLGLQDRGFGWNVEMQVRAIENGLRIMELPVGYFPRRAGQSKISGNLRGSIRAGWGILKMIAQLWWTKKRHSPVSLGLRTQPEPSD